MTPGTEINMDSTDNAIGRVTLGVCPCFHTKPSAATEAMVQAGQVASARGRRWWHPYGADSAGTQNKVTDDYPDFKGKLRGPEEVCHRGGGAMKAPNGAIPCGVMG